MPEAEPSAPPPPPTPSLARCEGGDHIFRVKLLRPGGHLLGHLVFLTLARSLADNCNCVCVCVRAESHAKLCKEVKPPLGWGLCVCGGKDPRARFCSQGSLKDYSHSEYVPAPITFQMLSRQLCQTSLFNPSATLGTIPSCVRRE